VEGDFGSRLVTSSWPLPSGSAGLIDAGQGPGFGQGGIVSWNGALWFAEEEASKLGRIDTAGNITEYTLPTQVSNPGYGPRQLSASPSGLWFLSDWAALEGRAARLNQAGDIDGYFSGGSYVRLSSVTATPDGGAWVTYNDGEGVSRLAADGSQTQFVAEPRYGGDSESTLGADGALWLSDGSSVIQRITDAGTVTNFAATGDAGDIVSLTTSGGSVWYAKFNPGTWVTPSRSGVVGKMSTSGVPTPFASPYEDLLPAALTPAADGGVWFTTHHGAGVGHVDPAGTYRVALMPEGQQADSVAVGPDGNLWFTDRALNRVGVITMAAFNASIASQTTRPPGSATRARVAGRKGTVVKGRAKIRIACSGSGSKCRGKVQVKKGKKKLAKGRYVVKAGKKKTVKVKLTKAGRKFFHARRSARLTVVLSGKGGPAKRKVVFRRKR
jgi:virginiamycin B lyase